MQFTQIERGTLSTDIAPPNRARLERVVREHRGLMAVLAVGLAVRLLLLAGNAPLRMAIIDEQHYTTLAASVLRGDGFAWRAGELTSMRPPLYPVFVALVWKAWGTESLQAVRGVQIILSLATVAGVYLLGLRLFDRRVAVAAAAILSLYPSFLFANFLLLTEVLFTLLLVVLALQYHALLRRPTLLAAGLVGAVLGLAALTRSVLWPFPVVLIPLLFFSLRATVRRRLALGVCLALGYVCIVGPWAARNTRLQHTFTVVDTMGGMNLRMGNYEHTPEDRMWDAVALAEGEKGWSHALMGRPEAVAWTDGEKEKWAQREAIAYMATHPLTTMRRTVLKFADFWGLEREMIAWFQKGSRYPAWMIWPAMLAPAIAYPLVALAAAIGLSSTRVSGDRTQWLMLVIVAFITAVHAVVFGHSRYHLPLVAFLSLYAAAAWVGWRAGTLRLERPRLAVAALSCTALVAIWCYEILVRDADRLRTFLGAWV